MKLIQTPSLITGVILGASLITLSAASNDSVLGGLNVFVPGTTVSSAEVNDNFTYLDDEVTTLEGRVDNLEGSSSQTELLDFFHPVVLPGENSSNLSITVPQGYTYRIDNGHVILDVSGNGNTGEILPLAWISGFSPGNEQVNVQVQGLAPVDVETFPNSLILDGERGLQLLPGTTITFEAPELSSSAFTNLYVRIEKSPYNIQ